MSEWTVIKKDKRTLEGCVDFFTLGLQAKLFGVPFLYTIQHDDTGEEKVVKAHDEKELGDKISDGDFEEIEED